MSAVKHVAVVAYRDRDREYMQTVTDLCRKAGVEVDVGLPVDVVPDMVIVLGGDGSVLQYLHEVNFRGLRNYLDVPVFHVGTGLVNFFADITVSELSESILYRLARGDYIIDERAMLEVALEEQSVPVLNEVLIRYVNPGKITTFTVEEEQGEIILSGRMDGIVVSTPTGSTAYILALGGPVVDFRLDNVKVIIPVAPFSPALVPVVHPIDRSIVVYSEGSANIVCDGMVYGTSQKVVIKRHSKKFKFVRTRPYNFYSKLRRRLFTP